MSKPATIAQSGSVKLPTMTKRTMTVRHTTHRLAVGDELCVMSWGRNTYDRVIVTDVMGEMVRVEEEQGEVRTMPATAVIFLAGQAAAHFGRGPETPGVGYITPAEGQSHGITDAGLCIVCVHNH